MITKVKAAFSEAAFFRCLSGDGDNEFAGYAMTLCFLIEFLHFLVIKTFVVYHFFPVCYHTLMIALTAILGGKVDEETFQACFGCFYGDQYRTYTDQSK